MSKATATTAPAPQETTAAEALTYAFGIGDKVNFSGYADDVPAEERVFTVGQVLIITALPQVTGKDADGNDVVNGYAVADATTPAKTGQVFEEEVTLEATAEQWGFDPNSLAKATKKRAAKPEAPASSAPAPTPAKKTPAKKAPAKKADETPPAAVPAKKQATPPAAASVAPAAATDPATAEAPKARRLTSAEHQPADSALTLTPAVTAVVDGKQGLALLSTVDELVRRIDETYFTLGGTLLVVKESGAYRSLTDRAGKAKFDGKSGFHDYCEEQGIGYRKAMYQIGIYEFAVGLGLDESDFNRIGWSKAKDIARLDIDADAARKLIKYAESHTVGQVQEKIRKEYLSDEDAAGSGRRNNRTGGVALTKRTIALLPDQNGTVEQAIARAKEMIGKSEAGDPSDGAAFALIAEQWLQMQAGE